MTKQKVLLALLFCLFSVPLFSQSKQDFDREALSKILYQHANDDGPGMALGIVKEGQIIYEHYTGYANLEHEIRKNST